MLDYSNGIRNRVHMPLGIFRLEILWNQIFLIGNSLLNKEKFRRNNLDLLFCKQILTLLLENFLKRTNPEKGIFHP